MHTSTHITIISQATPLSQEMLRVLLAARYPRSHSGPGGDMEEIERREGRGERIERSEACWDSHLVTGLALASIRWSTRAITFIAVICVGTLSGKRKKNSQVSKIDVKRLEETGVRREE